MITDELLFLYFCGCKTANFLSNLSPHFHDWLGQHCNGFITDFPLSLLVILLLDRVALEKDSWLTLSASRLVSASQLLARSAYQPPALPLVSAPSPTGCRPAWVAGWCQTANWGKPWSLSQPSCFSCTCTKQSYSGKNANLHLDCRHSLMLRWHQRTPLAGNLDFFQACHLKICKNTKTKALCVGTGHSRRAPSDLRDVCKPLHIYHKWMLSHILKAF